MNHTRSNIVRFCNRDSHPALAYGVYDLFHTDAKNVRKAALELERQKINLVGQLIQLSKEQVLAFPFINQSIFEVMEAVIHDSFGLQFNSALPRWNKKYASILPRPGEWNHMVHPS